MKKKTLLKSISSIVLLLVIGLLVTMSCKKEPNDQPPTPPPPISHEFKDLFENKPLKMFSDYEIANNLNFPGHVMHQVGNGLVGGAWGIFKGIGKGLWEFHEYKEGNTRFDELYDGIQQIENQLTQLQEQLDALGIQLDMDVTEMKQLIESGDMNELITNIQSVMDSSTHTGYGYFMMEGAKFQAGTIDTNQMNIDTAYATAFAKNVFNKESAYNVTLWSEQIHALVCPSSGGTQDNAFRTYANLIIQQTGEAGLIDTVAQMNAYLLFESYFMQIINNQFQCMMIWANACNYIDTTGYQTSLYWEGTFRRNIKAEIEAYLETVEYLALNLFDYRHVHDYNLDFAYIQYGLAPDYNFRNILARSQFLANLLYDGLGVPYPVMCGTVITPSKYSTELGHDVDSIAMMINGIQIASTANTMKSRYPYTYWELSDKSECSPDNNWHVYRFGKASDTINDWECTEQDISLVDDLTKEMEVAHYPWSHFATPKGKITPLYYNPLNPNETSTTQTDSNFVQFAFFAARWNWGYPFLSMNTKYNKYQTGLWGHNGCHEAPFFLVVHNTGTYDKEGIYDYDFNAVMTFNAKRDISDDNTLVLISDMQSIKFKTGDDLPEVSGEVQVWGTVFGSMDMADDDTFSELNLYFDIGTGLNTASGCNTGFGDIVSGSLHENGTIKNFDDKTIESKKEYLVNTEYSFDCQPVPKGTITLQIEYHSWMQVVYRGNYDLN